MLSQTLQENAILDKLQQQNSVQCLLIVAIELISDSVYKLMLTVFRKENHAINYVIPSLVETEGPLSNIVVRLRLLYALGILSRDEYEDIELLLAIRDEINKADKKYNFIDDEILAMIQLLHSIQLPNQQDSILLHNGSLDSEDGTSTSIYYNSYQKKIRSALILAITDIIMSILDKTSITYFP